MQDPGMDSAARWLAARAEAHFIEAGACLAARPKGRLIARA
jgi:phytoene synthase